MGALASCEHCGCLGGNDGLTKPNTENDTDESSSEEEITTDEETELINKTKNKTKNKERDESYILYSDDEIDNKTKKSKKSMNPLTCFSINPQSQISIQITTSCANILR
eukprot:391939_1